MQNLTIVMAILSLLLVLVISILATKIAAVALAQTGLSQETARFQARSAFTGVGFTTAEAERVVNHPVRRRILMVLMLLGNAGVVTAISSLILGFVPGEGGRWLRAAFLAGGIAGVWVLASNPWIDRKLSTLIEWGLKRWTRVEVKDYAKLLRLAGGYRVGEFSCQSGDWVSGKTLAELGLRDEGVLVLGISRCDGTYIGAPRGDTRVEPDDTLILYGRQETLERLDERREGPSGNVEHDRAIHAEQEHQAHEREADERRKNVSPGREPQQSTGS